MKKSDLHIHTTASDGTLSPKEVVDLADDNDLELISITDHDTINGYEEARQEGLKKNIDVIPGVEITSDFHDRESHLLAYNFDLNDEALVEFLKNQKKIRVDRAKKIIDKLNKLGFDITFDEVRAYAGHGVIARPHIAAVLVEKAYVGNSREAFNRYLGNHAPAYYKCEYRSVSDILNIVHNAGGVVILAHPGNNYSDSELQEFIEEGIDGFEYIHPSHNYFLQKKYERLADQYELLKTGGSDFHNIRFDEKINFGVIAINTKLARRVIDVSEDRKHIHTT